jgi:spermidine synthase
MSDEAITATPSPNANDSSPPTRHPLAELFLISVLILFLELACIRWFPAHVLFLTFFTNTVLLACFLGMSLGCLAAGHPRTYLNFTPVLLGLGLVAGCCVEVLRDRLEEVLDVGHQASPQFVYFGTEYFSSGDVARFVIPIEVLGGFFFMVIALAMVGPGQELGRALNRVPNRIQAYTVNILGSIAGIVLFALFSWLHLSPGWWFAPIALGIAYFLLRQPAVGGQLVRIALLLMIVVVASGTKLVASVQERHEFWSPYYRIDYIPKNAAINVNLIGHQQMIPRDTPHVAYALPYLLHRDAGGKPFENIMIIGAGSGNDVSRALQWGAPNAHIDAVEIDPVIQQIGAKDHKDRPYQDNRVTVHLGDGRNFLKSTNQQYDLVVYALVDSLVLHSSYSNIRLESYLFTKQAFEDVRRVLKPEGVFIMYNYFRQGWIVARLQKTIKEVFHAEPLVLTLPYEKTVDPDKGFSGFTIFIAGSEKATQPIRQAFAKEPQYWLSKTEPPTLKSPNGFITRPPAGAGEKEWEQFGLARVEEPADLLIATDDWPFLYLRRPMIPDLSVRGALIMGGLALLLLFWFVPQRQGNPEGWTEEWRQVLAYWFGRREGERGRSFDGRMFFLGAGFMLIETKAVVQMALLFGSTWMVNSVVFFAVLVMILAANLFVLKVRPQALWPYYAGLFVTLALNAVIPLDHFLGMAPTAQIVGSCTLVFAPILFAAVIFAVSFSRTREADRAFGFNIAGAMLGGLAEYTSMLLGFQYLVLVALGFYVFSAVWVNGCRAEVLVKSPEPQAA